MMGRAALMEAIAMTLLTDRAAEGVPDGPDAELIRWCRRLHAVEEVYALAHEVILDDDERSHVLEPLDERWDEIAERLRELAGPTTAEGARAVAAALLTQFQGTDLAAWLTVRCAEYVVRGVP
jgi:hypothetical protein